MLLNANLIVNDSLSVIGSTSWLIYGQRPD